VCETDGKQKSNIEWEKTEKGSRNKKMSIYRVGARWTGSHRARQSWKSQRKEEEKKGEQIQSVSQMDGKP
jgi:hypothetical protein